MRVYFGLWQEVGGCVVGWMDQSNVRLLDPRLDLWGHSPDGFRWGYPGSGAAQLALAILADVAEDDNVAVSLYQAFKREFIAPMPRCNFIIHSDAIRKWLVGKLATWCDEIVDLSEDCGGDPSVN